MVHWKAVLVALAAVTGIASAKPYYGKKLGSLSTLEHGVRGDVYAVDSRTLHIKNFNYDGQAPDAYFYVGTGTKPSGSGYKVPDENGSTKPLGAYRNKDLTLTLPNGVTMDKVQWISVWCHAYSVDFGSIVLSRPVSDYPRPQRVGRMQGLEHDVSSGDIVVVDAQTILIPDFSYDGEGPDAHFWVGKGPKPSRSGKIVPDENGASKPLRSYGRKTVVLTLPGSMTVSDVDWMSVWCRKFSADFGHVMLGDRKLNVPPSLKMLGVKPQTKLNCEVLDDSLAYEVRWAVAGESIVMQLVSKIDDGQYMAFGLSGADSRSVMAGADAVVAWLDRESGQGFAYDYYLQDKAECDHGAGACPDTKLQGGKNGVRLLNSAFINGFSMLTFQRPLKSADSLDRDVSTSRPQAVVWAVGPLTDDFLAGYHSRRVRSSLLLDFGRSPAWNCPVTIGSDSGAPGGAVQPDELSRSGVALPSQAPQRDGWTVPPIECYEPEDRVYYAQVGPTGGARGYEAITGHVGWGIAWYINGLLVPEVNVVRGQTYTFVVEGGRDPNRPAKYHPFYITDDPEGGYQFKTAAERRRVRVFAGVERDRGGAVQPTATGRLCEWRQDMDRQPPAGGHSSFGAFQRTLQLDCEEGQPGILQWTPDRDTPDTVYYQCFTHRFLGWKINVLDSCPNEKSVPASRLNEVNRVMKAEPYEDYDYYGDGLALSSVRVEQPYPNVLPSSTERSRLSASNDYDYLDYYDDQSYSPPTSVTRRPSQPSSTEKSGFSFNDFPLGFPRPNLPAVSAEQPIPRPNFDFGTRLKPKTTGVKFIQRTRSTTKTPEVTLAPPLDDDFFSRFKENEQRLQSQNERIDYGGQFGESAGTWSRRPTISPKPASLPPRRTLSKINRPPVTKEESDQIQSKHTSSISWDYSSTERPKLNNALKSTYRTTPRVNPTQQFRPQTTKPSFSRPPSSTQTSPIPAPSPSPAPTAPPTPPTRPSTPRTSRPTPRTRSPTPPRRPPTPSTRPPTSPPTKPRNRPPPPRPSPSPAYFVPSLPPTSRPLVSLASRWPQTQQSVTTRTVGKPPAATPKISPPRVSTNVQSSDRPVFAKPRPIPPGHGFNPLDLVLESGFKPVKRRDRNNPPLAFEVSDVAVSESNYVGSGVVAGAGSTGSGFRPSPPKAGGFRTPGKPDGPPGAVSITLPVAVVPVGPSQPTDQSNGKPLISLKPPTPTKEIVQSKPTQSESSTIVIKISSPRPENTPQPNPDEPIVHGDHYHRPNFQHHTEHQQSSDISSPSVQNDVEFQPQFNFNAPTFQANDRPSSFQRPPPPVNNRRRPFQPSLQVRQPPRRQQGRPPGRPRPGGFLSSLLDYIPGLKSGRPGPYRRRQQQHHFTDRLLNTDGEGWRQQQTGVRVPEDHPDVPVPVPVMQPGPVDRRLSLEMPHRDSFRVPEMQPVFDRVPFRPSPVDTETFQLRIESPTRSPAAAHRAMARSEEVGESEATHRLDYPDPEAFSHREGFFNTDEPNGENEHSDQEESGPHVADPTPLHSQQASADINEMPSTTTEDVELEVPATVETMEVTTAYEAKASNISEEPTPQHPILADIWSQLRESKPSSAESARHRRESDRVVRSAAPEPEPEPEPEPDSSNGAIRSCSTAWQLIAPLVATFIVRWRSRG